MAYPVIIAAAITAAAAVGTTAYSSVSAQKAAKRKRKEQAEREKLDAYEEATRLAGTSTGSQQSAISALLDKNKGLLGG